MRRWNLIAVFAFAISNLAIAQAPLPREARAGDAVIQGMEVECHTRMHSCEWATRASLRVTTGSSPVRIRVLRLEASPSDGHSRRWMRRAAAQIQFDTDPPQVAHRSILIPANGTHEVGVTHPREALRGGIDYRITLEVDGQRILVHASERVALEHPRSN
jgi:hypothetical protein